MSSSGLPPEVERFIARHIRSVEMLEIVLLVRRERRAWTGEQVARELRIDPNSAAMRLEELAAGGLLRKDGGEFTYVATGEPDRDLDALARAYAERRVAVITWIVSQPTDRLRSFADAFRFRGGR